MKNRLRVALAGVLALLWTLMLGVPHASADVCSSCDGMMVYNQTTSSNKLLIWNGKDTTTLAPGQFSTRYTYWQDVDAFMSPWCDAQRYNNGQWTTVYKAGVWYYYTNWDESVFSIRVAWC